MELLKISKYFTNQTLDEIIQKSGGLKHTSYKFTDGDDRKGDSYLSEIYRMIVYGVKQDGEILEVKLIVKSMPKSPSRRKIFRSSEFFRNEIKFYTCVITKYEAFQNKKAIKNPFVSYPKCLAVYCDGENDFVALEDISYDGYMSPVRQNYTDIETCILIMKTLGRFHAVSLAINDQEGLSGVIDELEEVYYKESLRSWYQDYLKLAISVANDAISKTYPNSEYERKSQKFLGENLYDDMIAMAARKTKYAVIGHGDCWRPNFLAKYDDNDGNKPNDIKIIDFQLARFGSPVLDIMFFIYNSTSDVQRNEHYELLIKEYHTSACELLKDLGSDPEKVFPMDGLKNELKEFGRFGCGFGIESLPLSMMDDDDITDLDSVKCEENGTLLDFWKIKPIENLENRSRLASIFKHSIDNNYIE